MPSSPNGALRTPSSQGDSLITRIQALMDKYNFKSFQKLQLKAKEKNIAISNKELKEIFDANHSKAYIRKYNRKLMGNMFSAIDDFYQMDIYFRGKSPYLLFINVNTRYASIYKLDSKSAPSVLDKLKAFVMEHHPRVIECDDDRTFRSVLVLDYLRENHVTIHISLNQLHTDLSIINSFCRTLNSLIPSQGSPERAVKIYNKTPHSSLGVSPKKMQENKGLQYEYIYNQLQLRDAKEKLALKDEIKKGDRVRYILDEDRKKKKFEKNQRKYKLSKEYYIVEAVFSPFSYLLIAEDGGVKRVPRYRICKLSQDPRIPFAKTFEDPSNFEVQDEILDYRYNSKHPKKSVYEVRVITRDARGRKLKTTRLYHPNELRDEYPNRMTALEDEFLAKHPEYKYSPELNLLVPNAD